MLVHSGRGALVSSPESMHHMANILFQPQTCFTNFGPLHHGTLRGLYCIDMNIFWSCHKHKHLAKEHCFSTLSTSQQNLCYCADRNRWHLQISDCSPSAECLAPVPTRTPDQRRRARSCGARSEESARTFSWLRHREPELQLVASQTFC